jgi:isoquinoline 1-oxidoreductase subunit alpha
MDQFKITINNTEYTVHAAAQTPLLWVIRDSLGLTGTKYGCGVAQCGACTVHINEMPVRSCSIPISAAVGKKIVTIEGVSDNGDHPVQQAWVQESVAQCGYCQGGQIMSAIALLNKNKNPSDTEINLAMRGNICRCGTYLRIRKAIHTAASKMNVTNN